MTAAEPPPATGAWQEGDPAAFRRFEDLGPLKLDLGGDLPSVQLAYETWGELSGAKDNAVLVEHALTGDAHASGPVAPGQPTPGWWQDLIGPGLAIDTNRWFVVCANVLGGCQGSTGPSSLADDGKHWGSRWPRITIRDQVAAEAKLADRLGIDQFAAVIGGSMGGMRALEWVVGLPDRVQRSVVVASGAVATADQIGTQTAQIAAITSDPNWRSGDYYATGERPCAGLGVARRVAHLTYRTELELDERFGTLVQPGEDALGSVIPGRNAGAGRFEVQSYLDHHATKLAGRFDAGSYVSLTDAMSTHDVSRGRGDLVDVLGAVRVPVWVGGVESDRLYPLRLQQQIADLIPSAKNLAVIESPYGHDGFLLESDAVAALIMEALAS